MYKSTIFHNSPFLSLPHSPVKRATAKGRWVVDGSKLGKMGGKNYPDAFGEGAL